MTKPSFCRAAMLLAFVSCLSLVFAYQAKADNLAVCSSAAISTSCGNDPNIINPASIFVGFNQGKSALAPLVIIVGVPNTGPAPTLSLTGGLNPAAAGTYYGLHFATTGTLAGALEGTLTSANFGQNDAYAQSGISTSDKSESWSNWNGFDTAHSVTVGSAFNLYAFAINCALGTATCPSPINIDFTGLDKGSFVIAYGCEELATGKNVKKGTCASGKDAATPFTRAGANLTSPTPPPVPEPASMLLMGTGLVALGGMLRRRKSGKSVVA